MSHITLAEVDNAWGIIRDCTAEEKQTLKSDSLIYSGHWYLDVFDLAARVRRRSDMGSPLRLSYETIRKKVAEVVKNWGLVGVSPNDTDGIRQAYKEKAAAELRAFEIRNLK